MAHSTRGVVRENRLEITLENFNAEMGVKVAAALSKGLETYHEMQVDPIQKVVDALEARVVALEAASVPWWRRLAQRLRPQRAPEANAPSATEGSDVV